MTPPLQSAPKASTPIAFVNAVLLGYQKYGADPSAILAAAQIAPNALHDPEARITAWQLEVLTAGAMKELDDETLGWFSRRLPWGTYGLLCRASLSSKCLGSALHRWFRHHALLTSDIGIALEDGAGGLATVIISEHNEFGEMRELCLMTYLRFIHGFACWMVDSRIPLVNVTLPFKAPAHAENYRLMFPGHVEFGAQCASLVFESRYLALSHQRDETALEVMLRRPLALTILPYRRDRLLVQRIQALLTGPGGQIESVDTIAAKLNMSPRTMSRQLETEGTSFQRIKDKVRKQIAMDMLSRGSRQIKYIAASVGYSSEKAFARAFRQWTGQSPMEFRHAALAHRSR